MRVFVLAALLFVSLGAMHCGKGSPKQSDGPAGRVVSMSGNASAISTQHGERKLAIGDVVYREDRIVTETESSIEIRLEHNGARWSLVGAREVVVSESPAWRAKVASNDLLDPTAQDMTGAAGRHGEKQAGEDSSVLLATTDEAQGAAANESEPLPFLDSKNAIGRGGDGMASPPTDEQPTNPIAPIQLEEDNTRAATASGKSLHLDAPATTGSGYGKGSGSGQLQDKAKKTGPAPKFELTALVGPMPKEIILRVLRQRGPQLAFCAESSASAVKFSFDFEISKLGAITKISSKPAAEDKQISACVQRVLARLLMPSAKGVTSVQLAIELPAP